MDSQLSETDERPPEVPTQAGRPSWRARRPGTWLLETLSLLVAPVAVLFGLHELPMAGVPMIDRYFYQAYTEHGADLIQRYGAGGYYWVRLAFIVPSRLLYLTFGAIGGFFAFRYLLALVAVIPAYLLFRRLHGRAAGAVVVAGILSCPVIVYAWGTDYPDSSAVSYLIAGSCLLLMPSSSRRARLGWVAAGGCMLTLTVHSQAVSAPLVAIIAGVYLLGAIRRSWLLTALDAVLLLTCAVVVTGLMAFAGHVLYGHWNIISPTLTASKHLRSPAELRKWHTVDWRWVLRDPYLAVPLLGLVAWLAVRLAVRRPAETTGEARWSPGPEAMLAAMLALQVVFFAWWQFFDKGYGLEYHFASSMLWPATVLVLALAVVRVSGPLLRRRGTAAVPTVLVLAVPYALTWTRGHLTFGLAAGLVTVAVVAAVIAAWARWQPDPVRHVVVGATLAATVGGLLTGGGYALTAGENLNEPLRHCQRPFPQPQYATVLRTDKPWHVTEDQYKLAAELNEAVPPAKHPGEDLLMWYPAHDLLASGLAAQFLWTPNALRAHLPTLTTPDVKLINKRRPTTMLLMGTKDTGFDEAVSELSQAGAPMNVTSTDTLKAGPYTFHVWVLTSAFYDAKLVSHHAGIPTKSTLVPCGAPASGAKT